MKISIDIVTQNITKVREKAWEEESKKNELEEKSEKYTKNTD